MGTIVSSFLPAELFAAPICAGPVTDAVSARLVPRFYPLRKAWVQSHELARYGVAYGLDDLAHARATRHLTLGVLQAQEAKGMQSVQNFVSLTQSRFG